MATKKRRPETSPPTRRRWLPLLVLAALGVAFLFWLPSDDDQETVEDVPVEGAFREGDIVGGAGARGRGSAPVPAREGDSNETELPPYEVTLNTQAMFQREIDDYRRAARYPQSNEPIDPGAPDPVLRDRTPTHVSAPDRYGDGRLLTTWPEQVGFEHPQPVVLHAAFTDNGQPVSMPATITGRIVGDDGRAVAEIGYFDDGSGPDAEYDDGIYTAAVRIPDEHVPSHAEPFRVLVTAVVGSRTYANTAGFLYSNPWSALTGHYRDQVREGSLVFGAELDVRQAGRFHMQATIADAEGVLIGWGQAAARLEPGLHWLEITFYGLLFHDAGKAGPYRITSLSLATVVDMPAAFNELQRDVHTTAAYELDRFTTEPFNEPEMLQAAERAEREQEALRSQEAQPEATEEAQPTEGGEQR